MSSLLLGAPDRKQRRIALLTALALVAAVLSFTSVATAPPAAAADTNVSTFTKAGTNAANDSTATVDTPGDAKPGDTINWVLNYNNKTGGDAAVNITDPITDGQSYVQGSLKLPPSLAAQFSPDGGSSWNAGAPPAGATGVGGVGTVPGGTKASRSPQFTASTANFTTPGGDGYSVEGFGNNIYTVFHHNSGDQMVFCATLSNEICDGWPGYSSYVGSAAGTALGSGTVGEYTSMDVNGSFIEGGKLYWPIHFLQPDPVTGDYTAGIQCLDLNSLTSCGFTPLYVGPFYLFVNANAQGLAGDGIAAADGSHYYFAPNGSLYCFNSASGACGSYDIAGANGPFSPWVTEVGTYQDYVYVSAPSLFNLNVLSCFNTATQSLCGGAFPVVTGPAQAAGYGSEVMPFLDATGNVLGGCAVYNLVCYSVTGTPMLNNPYSQQAYAFNGPVTGFGTGTMVAPAKYYTIANSNDVACFDFALGLDVNGKVQPCATFTTVPHSLNGYTVRSLANLPGCMAANGDGHQITIFNAVTGGTCTSASTTVTLSPSDYYCDSTGGHANVWDRLELVGLTGTEYLNATVTLSGTDGQALTGWTNITLPAGQTSLDVSSIPVSGNTTKLTAQVNLVAVTDVQKVAQSTLQLSWQGDSIQVCYQTTIDPVPCLTTPSVSNTALAVTTNGNMSDAPAGNSSGAVSFTVQNPDSSCMIEFSKTADPNPAKPGQTVTYTITAHNAGTADYGASNPASFSDDLTDVLKDADYGDDAAEATGQGTVSFDDQTNVLSWSGPLAADDTVTITYTAKVHSPDTGDHLIANRVVSDNPSNCGPDSTDPACEQNVPVSGYTVTKAATETKVNPGGTVTYTITVQNIGQVAYTDQNPASFDDDLSDVLKDAAYNDDATVINGDGTVSFDDNTSTLSWSGPLPVDGTATVQYTVKVNAPDSGDKLLQNTVSPGTDDGFCADNSPAPCATIEVPVQSFSVAKQASTETVTPGEKVTYTLTVTNTGQVAYTDDEPATLTDDLSKVIDDAGYNDDAKADSGDVSYSEPALSWTGALGIGDAVTISYTVTVDAPDAGDYQLINAVTPTGPGGTCPDGSLPDPTCDPVTVLVKSFSAAKVASATEAKPGDKVSYSITVTNTGKVDYAGADLAAFSDDLAKVLDDASYNNDAKADAGTVAVTDDGVLSWAGPLAIGAKATISYSVTVDSPDQGDYALVNAVAPDNGGTCEDGSLPDCDPTTVLVASYTVAKAASDEQAGPGETVSYTITVTNTGKAPYTSDDPASFNDDLTQVLDDASYNKDAKASAGDVKVADSTLSWAGPLPVGEKVTVTYTVTIQAPDAGDYALVNAATPTSPGGLCVDGSLPTPECDPVTVLVRAYAVAKTVSATKVQPGGTVTYTVTVTNLGKVAYTKKHPATFTDDMSKVLDDAKFNNDATGGAKLKGHTLSWAGALGLGKTATVTYSVTVQNPIAGDGKLHNVVTTPTDPKGIGDANCPTGSEQVCVTDTAIEAAAAAPGGEGLADTGAPTVAGPLLGGLLMLITGMGLLVARRRRHAAAMVEGRAARLR